MEKVKHDFINANFVASTVSTLLRPLSSVGLLFIESV